MHAPKLLSGMKNQTYYALFELNEIYFGQFIQLYLKKNVKQDHN